MLIDALISSTLILASTSVILFAIGRRPLSGRFWRVALLLPIGVAVAYLTGQAEPLSPAMAVMMATVVVAVLMPGSWWAAGAVAFASQVVATVVYLAYLVRSTIVLADSPLSLALGLVLLAIEVSALGLMVAAMFEVIDSICRPLVIPQLPDPPTTWPTVCLQIPAHQEPPELVLETLRSLIALDYPRESLVVQILDNNTTDPALWQPVASECRRLAAMGHRVYFVHLADWPGYKAGALNWGRAHLPDDVRIVGVIDADYVVAPDYLRATVPYFEDPTVAFLQTPQEYRDWRGSAFYRACHTGFAYFFRVGMVSRSYRNSIIFAGTMGLIRRTSLDAIGGWDEEIITEDAEASLRILGDGGRGIYLPQAYGRGIMPLTYEALRSQRFRWAFGGIQILRKHWRVLLPWSRSRLTLRQRRDYLLGGLWWFNDGLTLLFAVFVAATAVGIASSHPFVVQRLTGLGIVLPLLYILVGLARYLWGIRVATRVPVGEAFDAMRVNLSLSWVVSLACVRALIEEKGVFLRTPKFRGSHLRRELRVVAVETAIALAMLAVWAWSVATAGVTLLTLTIGALTGWSVLIYGSATAFALGDPTRAPAPLRSKAALELAQSVGRAVDAHQLRISVLLSLVGMAVLVAVAVGSEAGRPAVTSGAGTGIGGAALGGLFPGAATGPSIPSGSPPPTVSPIASPGGLAANPSALTTTSTPSPSDTAGAASSPPSVPSPTSSLGATPTPSPSAPVPSPAPTPSNSPSPAPTPSNSPSPGPSTQPVPSLPPSLSPSVSPLPSLPSPSILPLPSP